MPQEFSLDNAINLLSRTPAVLESLLQGLPDGWLHANEGEATWSAYEVVGHLVHGEKTDWISRMKIILSDSGPKTFTPFDRFAMLQWDQNTPLTERLSEFRQLRHRNLQELKSRNISATDLQRTATHPALGMVTLSQLLSSWVAHDLSHLAQISRVLAFQYRDAVGPWKAFMGILNSKVKDQN